MPERERKEEGKKEVERERVVIRLQSRGKKCVVVRKVAKVASSIPKRIKSRFGKKIHNNLSLQLHMRKIQFLKSV